MLLRKIAIDPILRLPDVKAVTGLGRTSIYRFQSEETFPQSVSLGKRSVGWRESEIKKWVEERTHLKKE